MKVLVPRDTLHKEIHHQIRTVPLPEPSDAKKTFELLVKLEACGKLDPNASLEKRLDFLIEHMSTQTTVETLIREREIVRQFYSGESS